jgi:hypothetical protein
MCAAAAVPCCNAGAPVYEHNTTTSIQQHGLIYSNHVAWHKVDRVLIRLL